MARRTITLDAGAMVGALAEPPLDDDVAEQVLAAAADLMAQRGIRHWSMEDVADRAGVGRTTLYRRFEARDDLVHAVLARECRSFLGTIAAGVDPGAELADQVVDGLVAALRATRDTLLDRLLRDDPDTVLPLVTTGAGPLVAGARMLLVELAAARQPLTAEERAHAELVAEVLVRLAFSFAVAPESVIDLDDEVAARAALARIVTPLLDPPSRRSRPLPST